MPTKTKNPSIMTFGKIEVEKNDGTSPYMPQNGGSFVDHGDILKTLAIAVRDNLPVLLMGESGTGKTSAIRYLANQTGNGLRRVNLNGGTTADELVGRLLINDKGTYWVDGVLTEAMRKGEWIVLDEINAALPEVLFVLQSVMDDDGYLVLTEKDDKEIVHKHKNFRLFATCNPPEYAGTKEMNKALLSRFAICISADFPSESKELEIIKHHLGAAIAQSELAVKLVSLAQNTRKAKESGTAEYAINTRDVLNTLRLSESMDPMNALAHAFANKLDPTDTKALMTIAKLHLPQSKKRANAVRADVQNTENININATYVFKDDVANVYFGLTDSDSAFDSMKSGDIGSVIQNSVREHGVKGDEFQVIATFYEQEDKISEVVKDNAGSKVASAIQIIDGANKGKKAIIFHHPDIENTADIINHLHEIS